MTKIEWTDTVWNVVTGCTKIASGCKHCYAARMANRLRGRCGYPVDDPFRVTLHPDRLEQPLHWQKPRMVFVNSMGDLFHEDVPFSFVDKVLSVMALTPQHRYQILTKRPQQMYEYFESHKRPEASMEGEACAEWLLGFVGYEKWLKSVDQVCDYFRTGGNNRPNLWLGTSASAQKDLDANVPLLLNTPAAVRFVSLEPLLGPIDLVDMIGRNRGLDWVIVGCESGPHARPMDEDWVRSIRDQCQSAGVKFFYKQRLDGGKKISLPVLDGRTWDQIPEVKR